MKRAAPAAAVLALAAGALTACTPKAGAAAIVDDTRISTSDVSEYVTRDGPSPETIAQAAQQGQQLLPKSTVVTYLVQQQIFERTLTKVAGGVPSDAALNALHDKAAQTLLGATQTGDELDRSLAQNIGDSGFTTKFAPVVLRVIELEQALIDKVQASSIADLAAAVKKVGISIDVNPRYGVWDPANLDVSSGGTPSFLTLESATPTPSATTPAAG